MNGIADQEHDPSVERPPASYLYPVLIPILEGTTRPARENLRRQREAALRALNESARRASLPRQSWRRDAAGVPVLENGLFWSLSHKPKVSAGVVSCQPVGIDVEIVQPRREGLWDYIASASERRRVDALDWPMFFRFWTAKEAVLKASLAGLARLDDCRVVYGPFEDRAELQFAETRFVVRYHCRDDIIAAVAAPSIHDVHWCWFAPPAPLEPT